MGVKKKEKEPEVLSRCSHVVLSMVFKFTWRVILLSVIIFIFIKYIAPAIMELYSNFYDFYQNYHR